MAQQPSPNVIRFRRFGAFGPTYEILGVEQRSDGKEMVRIRLLESGEELLYPRQASLQDPEAA